MKHATKENCKDITKTILGILLATGGCSLLLTLSNGRFSNRLLPELGRYSSWQIKTTIKKMRLRKLVHYDDEDENSPIMLTTKGFARACTVTPSKNKEKTANWDYLWRVVIFDVREKQRWKRVKLQTMLKKLGWFRLQKSVYVNPQNPPLGFETYINDQHLEKSCLMLTVPNLGPFEEILRKKFME